MPPSLIDAPITSFLISLISWLSKETDSLSHQVPSDVLQEQRAFYTESICLLEGDDRFFFDEGWNLMCCENGEEHYNVTASDGFVIAEGERNFGRLPPDFGKQTFFSLPFIPETSSSQQSLPSLFLPSVLGTQTNASSFALFP